MLTTTAFLFLMTISVYGVVYGKTKELLYRKIWLIYYPFDTKEILEAIVSSILYFATVIKRYLMIYSVSVIINVPPFVDVSALLL